MKRQIPESFRRYIESGDASDRTDSPITWRGILVGTLMCVVIAVWVPYTSMVLQGTPMGFSSATPAAFFLLVALLLTLNVALGVARRSWALGRGELITIMIMMMVASAIPTRGVTGILLPMITGTFYYDSPDNDWARLIHPYLERWFVVEDEDAVRGFYEGNPGAAIPWAAWLPALMGWLLFYAAFYLTQTSILVILRRQWAEHERLVYPIAQVPLAMVEGAGRGRLLLPLFRNPVMWFGFAIPFCIYTINAIGHYYPEVGRIEMDTSLPIFRGTVSIPFRINFLILGFSYLINSSISLSIWFFYLVQQVQLGTLKVLGLESAESLDPWSQAGHGHQMLGALTVLVVWGMWTGREHLKEVLRGAWGDRRVDDSAEIMSYRLAVLGAFGGSAVMAAWLWLTGIPAWISVVLVATAMVILIGLGRVIAESGIPTVVPALLPSGFVVSAIGVPALGVKGMIATSYTMVWAGELLLFMSAPLANGLRMAGETVGQRRRLFWAIGVAIGTTLVISVWYTLHVAYRDGALNLHPQFFTGFATSPSSFAARKLLEPTGPSGAGYLWMLSGAAMMGLLMLARQQIAWWPFHPLGYAASQGWAMNHVWFPVFLAWLAKLMILKYGGAEVYRRTRPFFLGLVLGHFTVGGVWLLIDGWTGTVGNVISVLY